MKYIITLGVLLACVLVTAQMSFGQIRNSKHDLSSSSTSTIKSTNLDELCVFCHTPHSQSATTMLWNRTASGATYTVYTSPTMEQTVPQPGAESKNCLSCHDGTVAFNSLINVPGSGAAGSLTITMTGGDHMNGWDSLGTDLTNDHPIGLAYQTSQTTDAGLRAASTSGSKYFVTNASNSVQIFGTTQANARVECTSCHDPHKTTNNTFLVMANTASQLCLTCHNK